MTLARYARIFKRWRESVRTLARTRRLFAERRVGPSLVEARAHDEKKRRAEVSRAYDAWEMAGRPR